jgi:hypothetical protein
MTNTKLRRCKRCDKPLKQPKYNKSGFCTNCSMDKRTELYGKKIVKEQKK